MYNSYMYNERAHFPNVGEIILYTVNKSDNLYRLAKTFHSEVDWIKAMNDIGNNDMIHPGQQILIPYLYPQTTPQSFQRQSYDLYF